MTGDLWTAPGEAARGLSTLTEDERYQYFDQLQSRMAGVWAAMRLNHDDESVVVVPSLTLDRTEAAGTGTMMQAYEERFLFLLILLREPRLRMIYVTSVPIAPEIIEYYLALLPGVIPSHARARLSLIPVHDATPISLSEKLLARPRLLQRIADLIPNPLRSHLIPYNTTELERDVAISLGIPMYAADPRLEADRFGNLLPVHHFEFGGRTLHVKCVDRILLDAGVVQCLADCLDIHRDRRAAWQRAESGCTDAGNHGFAAKICSHFSSP